MTKPKKEILIEVTETNPDIIIVGQWRNELSKTEVWAKEDFFCKYQARYKGIDFLTSGKSRYKNKSRAIALAKNSVVGSRPFADGTQPFCIVAKCEDDGYYRVYSTDTCGNAEIIKEKMGSGGL